MFYRGTMESQIGGTTISLSGKSNFCGYSKWPKSQIQENKREREKVESDLNAEEAVCSC